MEKNIEYVLAGILIVLFAFTMFKLNITGFAGRTEDVIIEIRDESGNSKTEFERGDVLNAVVTVSKEEIYNRYMWIYKDREMQDLRVEGTSKLICGSGDFLCRKGAYTVKYRIEDTVDKFADGDYYIQIKKHNGEFATKKFAINGPYLGHIRNGVKY